MTKREVYFQIKSDANTTETIDYKVVAPAGSASDKNVMPFFKRMAGCFERYRFTSFAIEYVPVASSYTSGTLVVGFEWETTNKPSSYAQVATLSPCMSTAVYTARRVALPSSRMNALLWYDAETSTTYPFAVVWAALHDSSTASKSLGVLYAHYTVEFMGTRGE